MLDFSLRGPPSARCGRRQTTPPPSPEEPGARSLAALSRRSLDFDAPPGRGRSGKENTLKLGPDSRIWSRFASAFESVPSGPCLRVFSLPARPRPGGASKSRLRREIAASERAPGSSGLGGGVVWRRPHLALGGPRREKSNTGFTDE